MALSSSPKSNSSASKAAKPTFRKGAGRGPAAKPSPAKPVAASKAKPAKTAIKPKSPLKPKAKSAGAPKAAPQAALRGLKANAKGSKPVAAPKPKVATAQPKLGKKLSAKQAPVAVKPAVKAPAKGIGSLKNAVPRDGVPKVSAPKTSAPKIGMPQVGVAKVAKQRRPVQIPGFLKPVAAVFASLGAALGSLFSRIPLPKLSRGALLAGAGGVVAVLLLALVIANSGLFAAREIQINGSTHVEQETATALVKVPDGTTLLNVSEDPILESLKASPWVADVSIEREWPNKLIITPIEHTVKAIAFVTADELAWGISEQGTWIAPLSLTVAVDGDGERVDLNEDGSVPKGAKQLSPFDAALSLAQESKALLLTDVPSDAGPKSGEPVTSEVVLAGLEYAKTFTPGFVKQIKSLSVASVESIAAFLTSGIEVSLGTPENITEKERVVTKLLEQQEGVTYINVREPGAYTFRGAPQD